ncbi:MAG: DUF6624 domain-containing protein [Salibacteraceae bacterium]|mgnify:CR=1 FL=1
MKPIISLCLLLMISIGLSAQLDSNLIHRLDAMVTADQQCRGIVRAIRNGQSDTISIDQANSQMRKTDSLHGIQLKAIFDQYGFVGYDLAGKAGSHHFWMLVQHQDQHVDFQLAVLEKMKVAAENGNASFQDYAYLIDRIKVNQGQPQIYGTQLTLNEDSTSYTPKPVIAPDQLNTRRATAGLPPIEFYIKAMNKRHFGTIKKE